MNFKIERRSFWLVTFTTVLFLFAYDGCFAQSDSTNQKVNGNREGLWMKYRLNGKVKYKGTYLKGEKTGYWIIYHKNGIHHSEGELINGKRVGNWYLVHTESKIKLDMTIWHGQGNCIGSATLAW